MPDDKPAARHNPDAPAITIRQRKLLARLLDEDSPSVAMAARDAGYPTRQQAYKELQRPAVQMAFTDLLAEHGLDDDRLAGKLNELIEARSAIVIKGQVQTVPDNRTQLDCVRLVATLRGHMGGGRDGSKTDAAGGAKHQHVHLHLEQLGLPAESIGRLAEGLRLLDGEQSDRDD